MVIEERSAEMNYGCVADADYCGVMYVTYQGTGLTTGAVMTFTADRPGVRYPGLHLFPVSVESKVLNEFHCTDLLDFLIALKDREIILGRYAHRQESAG